MSCEHDYENAEGPVSAEAFEREHPALVGAMRKAVRDELELHADGITSADIQRLLDRCQVSSDLTLVESDSHDGISQCDDCFIRIAPHRMKLCVCCGIDRFPIAHAITSLLSLGAVIVACGVALGKAVARP